MGWMTTSPPVDPECRPPWWLLGSCSVWLFVVGGSGGWFLQKTVVKNCWRYKILSSTFSTAKNTVVRGLENVDALEGGEALFECQLSQPEVAAHTWLLDDEPVHTSENVEMVYFENGLRHLLLLKNLKPQDSCRVTFLAGDVVTSAFLTVRGAKLREGVVG